MLRRYTYSSDEFDALFGRDTRAMEYPNVGDPWCFRDIENWSLEAPANALAEDDGKQPLASGSNDVASLAEALEALQLIQANDDPLPGNPQRHMELQQQLEAEVASLRDLLAAARQECQRLRRSSRFHAMSHMLRDAEEVDRDGHDSAGQRAHLQTPNKDGTIRDSPANKSPRSPGLPPHLVAAGFRMCSD
ncbi:hypothetical protein BJ138DRAFT_1105471 [Hygrophoropsis aurantiaca]|uniref:Uncharacterized protein n=1 Tax=Hygrophoropsis aurantiaca TaxID=72124 RepID=A0ACB7ZZ98_9AGAM|nr:hypothetical protein BJ138DRAFT_1105471 [Hygrophoropsis aurantiaca]